MDSNIRMWLHEGKQKDELILMVDGTFWLHLNKVLYKKYRSAVIAGEKQNIIQFETTMRTYFSEVFKFLGYHYSGEGLMKSRLTLGDSVEFEGNIMKAFETAKASIEPGNYERVISRIVTL